jgi:hypothetical protein
MLFKLNGDDILQLLFLHFFFSNVVSFEFSMQYCYHFITSLYLNLSHESMTQTTQINLRKDGVELTVGNKAFTSRKERGN